MTEEREITAATFGECDWCHQNRERSWLGAYEICAKCRETKEPTNPVFERVERYVEATKYANADEQIDRDDINEGSLTYADLRELIRLARSGASLRGDETPLDARILTVLGGFRDHMTIGDVAAVQRFAAALKAIGGGFGGQ